LQHSFFPQWLNKPSRVQGAFVSDEEVSDVVDFIKNQGICSSYQTEFPTEVASSISGGTAAAAPADDKDEYFAEAGRFVIDKQKGSIGMLQRIFKIGFNRAARIMDQLEEAGVVGPEEGTKPRRILMDAAQFEEYLQSM
jgi:S-DNA-T family DNA segregation ATPase FtsK/SpoIIIE